MDFKYRKFIFLILLISALLAPVQAAADLNETMETLFDSMVNITAPDAHLSARRGIIDGGSVVVRNRISNPQIISFVPPRMAASCGGVDAFMGSFSFINADAFVNLLRSIASSAVSYAFQLAMREMCPSCSQLMTELREAAGKVNQWAGNSCQAAEALVNKIGEKVPIEKSLSIEKSWLGGLARSAGSAVDSFNSQFPGPGSTLATKTLTASERYAAGIDGNIAYRVLTDGATAASGWITGGDSDLVEELISLTGTVIISPVDPSQPNADEKTSQIDTLEPILSFRLLVGGGELDQPVRIYRCDTGVTNCMSMTATVANTTQFTPMADRVRELLLGSAASGDIGIVGRYVNNTGGDFTNDQKSFMELLPDISKNVRDLSRVSAGAARRFAEETSSVIALLLVESMVDELIETLNLAVVKSDLKSVADYRVLLDKLRTEIRSEKMAMKAKHGGVLQVQQLFETLMQANKRLPIATPIQATSGASS